MLSLLPTPLRVNGPISDMDRIERMRTALERIRDNAGHGYGGYYAVTAAEMALSDDDRLAAAQDAAQMGDCRLCGKPSLIGDHLTCERRENALAEAEGLPW